MDKGSALERAVKDVEIQFPSQGIRYLHGPHAKDHIEENPGNGLTHISS
jgi:hypothetical protein